jgi:hypothetical protein
MQSGSLTDWLDEVRGKTLRVLDGVSESVAHWSPPGLRNHILWNAGHAYVVVERLTMESLGNSPRIPPGWFEMFGWDSDPARVAADRWPTLAAVVGALHEQRERLRPLIAALGHDELSKPSPRGGDRTIWRTILHALHDEARHSGEISVLLKLIAAGGKASGGPA